MQTITTYCLLYESDGYAQEKTFISIADMQRFISSNNVTVIQTFETRILGSIKEITI